MKLDILRSLGVFYDMLAFSPIGLSGSTWVPRPSHYYSEGATFPLTHRSTTSHWYRPTLSMLPVFILHSFWLSFLPEISTLDISSWYQGFEFKWVKYIPNWHFVNFSLFKFLNWRYGGSVTSRGSNIFQHFSYSLLIS